MAKTVLVADDHGVYRAGLALLLRGGALADHVLEAASFDDALEQLSRSDVALALFDLDMPGMAGPQTLSLVLSVYPHLKIAVVSATNDDSIIESILEAGAAAYIKKSTSLSDMAVVLRKLLGRDGTDAAPAPAFEVRPLRGNVQPTRRQKDVLSCVARGLTNKEIARELGIAPGTVKIHLAALFEIFGASNRTELLLRSKPY